MFVSIKPLHVSVFFHDRLQGVLRCALCRHYSSRWFAFIESVLLHSMCMLSVRVWCSCLLVICLWTCRSLAGKNTKHAQMTYTCGHILCWVCIITHAATYCVIIQTQWTQISGRNSNGTKHSGGPPEDGREKKTETCRGFILTNPFWTFYWFECVLKCE